MRKIIITILLVFAVFFVLQNTQDVSITFISWSLNFPLALIIGIALGVGLCIGLLLLLPRVVRQKMKISDNHRQITTLMNKMDAQKSSESQPTDNSETKT